MSNTQRNPKTWQLVIGGVFFAALLANLFLSSWLDGWPWFVVAVALLAVMESLNRVGVLPGPRNGVRIFENQSALIAAFLCTLASIVWVRFGVPLVPDPRTHLLVILAPLAALKVAFIWLLWLSVRNGSLVAMWRAGGFRRRR